VTVQVTDDRSFKAAKTFTAKLEHLGTIKTEGGEIKYLGMRVDGPHPWEKVD
jgi:hypothetical protein